MSSTIKTKGIILKMNDTPGKDKLIYILTPNGLIKAFMTPKRSAGKKSYTVDLFAYGETILYMTDSGNLLVNSVTPEQFFYGIREDISRLYAAGYFAALSMYAAEDAETDTNSLFELLYNAFEALSRGDDVKVLKPVYEFKIAQLIGMTPCLEAKTKADKYYFAMDDGRLYTSPVPSSFLMPRTAVMCIYKMIISSVKDCFALQIPDQEKDTLFNAAQQYMIYHTERTFDALKYLNGVI